MSYPNWNPQNSSNSTATNHFRSQPFKSSSKVNSPNSMHASASPSIAPSRKTSASVSPTGTPLQRSPEFGPVQDGNTPGFVSPFQLPSASLTSSFPPTQSSMSTILTDSTSTTRSAGLVRRISQKSAMHAREMIRTRPSITNIRTQRDQSSGPLVRRGRAGSKTSYDTDSNFDTLSRLDGVDSDASPLDSRFAPTPSSVTASSRASSRKPSQIQVEEYPPVIPGSLEAGSQIIKVTNKKRKSVHFKLDTQAAKVTWRSQSKSLYIDDIHDIRRGKISQQATKNLALPPDFDENLCLTIVASDKRSRNKPIKSLFLIFENDTTLTLWTETLEKLTRYRQDLIAGVAGPGLDEKTLRSRWDYEMDKVHGSVRSPSEEVLNLLGVQRVCHSLHINWSNEDIERKFKEADKNGSGNLNYQQFRAFVKAAKERSDVMKLFLELKRSTADGLELEPFLKFLVETQGIQVSQNQKFWEGVFHKFVTDDKYNESQNPDGPLVMGFYAFNAFISSSFNSAISLSSNRATLDRPLNEYFISSSHNTYLLGRQIGGHSSTEGYVKALQEGCRCIEIDCWDRGSTPVVTHGHTKTTWILFKDCISTIAQFAFDATPYPLILSLEVHCNPANQQRMVDIMEQDFGEMLIKEPLLSGTNQIPSPEAMKHKILIKVKTTSEASIPTKTAMGRPGGVPATRRQRSISSPFTQSSYENQFAAPSSNVPLSPNIDSFMLPRYVRLNSAATNAGLASASSASEESDSPNSPTSPNSSKIPRSKIIDSLVNLAVYTRGLKYRGVFLTDTYNHIFSLAENTFDEACKNADQCMQLEKHNAGHLMRIYPSQLRIKSTNFDPLACWKRGVQMAALNFQTYDEGMHLNEAMFSSGSDRTGYVLKPRVLRPLEQISDHITEALAPRKMHRIDFSVDLISAQYLPRSEKSPMTAPSPYVEIQVYIADDKNLGSICGGGGQEAPSRDSRSCLSHRRRSQIRKHNGYDPKFTGDMFKFSVTTRYPELVFIRWSVWNSSDGKSYNNAPESENNRPDATFTVKLNNLQVGYRHLPLRTPSGEQFSFSTLFCKISKGEELEVLCNDPTPVERMSLFRRAGQRIGFGRRTGSTER